MNLLFQFLNAVQQEEAAEEIAQDVEKVQEGIKTSWDKLGEKLLGWKDNFIEHLPEILLALIVFVSSYILSIYIKRLVSRPLKRFIKRTSIRNLVENLVSMLVILIGIFVSISVLDLTNFLNGLLAAGGIAGLAVGLALQGTLANTFSGVFLSVNDMMNVGDWVETNGYKGSVEQINLRNTRIRESDNNIVVIPNKTIIESSFKNFALTPKIRTSVQCGVHYDSDLRAVKELVTKAIEKRFPQMEFEKVEFHYLEFDESSINFQVRFWIEATANVTLLETNSEAIMIIKETFDKNGIIIPFPIRTLEFANGLPEGSLKEKK